MKKLNSLSLKVKLLAGNMGLILFLTFFVVIQYEGSVKSQKDHIANSFRLYTENVKAAITEQFFALYHNVQSFSKNQILLSNNNDGIRFYFDELVSLYPTYDFMMLVGKDGQILASSSQDSSGKKLNVEFLKTHNVKNEKWFDGLLKGKMTENFDQKIFGSRFDEIGFDPLIEKVYSSKRLGNYVSAVVADEYGDPKAYIVTYANFNWVENEVVKLYKTFKDIGLNRSEMYILGKDGQLLVKHTPETNQFKNEILSGAGIGEVAYKWQHNFITKVKTRTYGVGLEKDYSTGSEFIFSHGPFDSQRFLSKELGWQAVIKVNADDAFSAINSTRLQFYAFLALCTAMIGVLLWFFTNKLSLKINIITDQLKDASIESMNQSLFLNSAATKVATSATQSSSLIQNTVATLSEFSEMVKSSADNAEMSRNVSSDSLKSVDVSKKKVDEVLGAIDTIKSSSDEMLLTITDGNNKIFKIIDMIQEISEKTKVINDIVFQTKLLSFNASVEAARAGEQGKGFAVVAEEVGNLANMSGKSAVEITTLVNQSIERVKDILNTTSTSVNQGITKSQKVIHTSQEIAHDCRVALDSVVQNVSLTDKYMNEIASASRELDKGIISISQSMNELDSATSINSSIAEETLSLSAKMKDLSECFQEQIGEMNDIVNGQESSGVRQSQHQKEKVYSDDDLLDDEDFDMSA